MRFPIRTPSIMFSQLHIVRKLGHPSKTSNILVLGTNIFSVNRSSKGTRALSSSLWERRDGLFAPVPEPENEPHLSPSPVRGPESRTHLSEPSLTPGILTHKETAAEGIWKRHRLHKVTQ